MIKSLNDVQGYVKQKKLEATLNQSFNKCQINSPKNTFYSIAKINKFCLSGMDFSYDNYYNFLSKEFPEFDKFSLYLKSKVDFWKTKDNAIVEKDALIYLLKKFVIDPIDGKLSELETKDMLQKRFPDYTITEPTPEEDMEECFDFRLDNGTTCFYIQHKPKSFFYKLNDRTKFSFIKIKKAAYKHKRAIFFTKKERGEVYFYNRSKANNTKMVFTPLNKFLVDTLQQDQINRLSQTIFQRVLIHIIK